MKQIGIGMPRPLLSHSVEWKDAMFCKPPGNDRRAYVVMVEARGQKPFVSTRVYAPWPVGDQVGWMNMGFGERVTHWLSGLQTPDQLEFANREVPPS